MKRALAFAVLLAFFSAPALAERSIKADVNGMVCSFCAAAIEKRLKSISATKAVYVDLSKKIVAVELNDGQDVELEKIAGEIRDSGYDVVKIVRSEQSIEQIRRERAK